MKLAPGLISETTGIDRIDESALGRADQFCTSLLDANKRINLISRGGDQPLEVTRQFLISLVALKVIPDDEALWWLDIGSGGGFPAVPLAIFRPQIHFVLAESMAKKAFFLERSIEQMGLTNVRIVNSHVAPGNTRLHPNGNQFDWLSIKAVTDWNESLRWGQSFLKPGGQLLTYKAGKPTTDETLAIAAMGFELVHTFDLGDFFDFTEIKVLILKRIKEDN